MSARNPGNDAQETAVTAPPSTVPKEFGKAMRQIHSGELTALSQRSTIRELTSAAGLIIKINSRSSD